MLPEILKSEGVLFSDKVAWEKYLQKIGDYLNQIDIDFLSQICFEHYDRFNSFFPEFDISKHEVIRITKTTKQVFEEIKYDWNEELNDWYFQVDDFLKKGKFKNYQVLVNVVNNKTWTFPPVIIDSILAQNIGIKGRVYGQPIHLIEGTHRISFVRRLYELDMVDENKLHEFLCIVEK